MFIPKATLIAKSYQVAKHFFITFICIMLSNRIILIIVALQSMGIKLRNPIHQPKYIEVKLYQYLDKL